MTQSEMIFIWATVGCYAVGFLLFLGGLVFNKPRLPVIGYRMAALGFMCHTAAIAVRWYVTGHLPVMRTYENSLTGTWFVSITYLSLRYWFPMARPFGVAVMPLLVLILGNALMTGGVLQDLEPAYRSPWLVVHVLFAWFAFGAYVLACAAGVLYLVREKGKGEGTVLDRLPEQKLLDELSLRLILFGFFAEALMTSSGAIWAHSLWGRYWAWDPVENWSLISWLIYGLNLHLRITLGWRGKRAAWLAIVSIVGIIFLFFGISFVSKWHTGIF